MLRLTAASRAVLRGEQRIALRQRQSEAARSRRSSVRATRPAVALSAADAALFERLRAWRATTAKAQGVPAYVVFSDATLLAIAQARPQSLAALRGISGIGDVKLERFGESLLSLTRPDD